VAIEAQQRVRRLDPRLGLAAVAVAVLVVTSPALRGAPDSYPLSTYPMFSGAVSSEVDLTLAVGIDAAGERVELDPTLIAGTDEVIVAGGTLRIAVREGRTDELCAEIAERLRDAGRDGIVAVRVVTDAVDAVGWYEGDRSRVTTLHTECPVP
jgi:hypothetical protein